MKKMLKALSIFSSVMLVIMSPVLSITAQSIDDKETAKDNREQVYIARQSKSIQTFFEVKAFLEYNANSFCGVFIDDNGDLNIVVKDSDTSGELYSRSIKTIKDTVDTYKCEGQSVIYRTAKHSLLYLQTVQEDIMEVAEDNGIISSYIDEKTNKVCVQYTKSDAIEKISRIIDNDCLSFEEAGMVMNMGIINNGSVVANASGIPTSIACGAKLGNAYGFITCGHGWNVGNLVFNANHMNIGVVTHKVEGGSADVAFILPNSSYLSTTYFIDGTSYTAGTGMGHSDGAGFVSGGFPTGTKVTRYGYGTSPSSGTIKSVNYSITVDGISFTKLVQTTCSVIGGDSGGPVKVSVSTTGLTYTYCAGIVKGGISYDGGSTFVDMFYTDMDIAKSILGFYGHYDVTSMG